MNQSEDFQKLIDLALVEDLAQNCDLSTDAIFTTEESRAIITAKSNLIVYGIDVVSAVLSRFTEDFQIVNFAKDGEYIEKGKKILEIVSATKYILRSERIILNFLGFLSGISTKTAQFVEIAKRNGKTKILDTRKTLPGFRKLSKLAVLAGGGTNHRKGLYDMVMLKDNHIDACGSIEKAFLKIREEYGSEFKIEVETRNLVEVASALELKVPIIMLDNMTLEDCKKAIELRKKMGLEDECQFEASGDMTLARVEEYSKIGLDFISIGQLTHSVENANLSMTIEDRL